MKRIPMPWATVYANSTTERKLAATPWMPARDIIGARPVLEIREAFGNIEVGVGIEVANVENSPNGSATALSRQTSVGVHYGSDFTDVSSTTQGKQLARFVYLTANTSGTDTNLARVAGYIDVEERCS